MGYSKNNIKFKLLSYEELVISLDRLTRFKSPDISYPSVFYSILTKCLINPKFSKEELEILTAEEISNYVKLIWNSSCENLWGFTDFDNKINSIIRQVINIHYKNIDERTKILIKTKLNIVSILNNIKEKDIPFNLNFLIKINRYKNINNKKLKELREKYSLKFPLERLIIVEGITEENLLPVFANKLSYNFDKNGTMILGAGGKSKSPSLYLKLKDKLKIPIILLFDNDAYEICNLLKNSIRQKDKIILIDKGEFEDIISLNLIKRALNKEYYLTEPILKKELTIHKKMCENLENFYKSRNLGEFKKAKFSKLLAENIKYNTDVTEDIKVIINKIISLH